MNKIGLLFWGRVQDLEIVYDCYAGEDIQQSQKEALDAFLARVSDILDSIEPKVKEYCLKTNPEDIVEENIVNIFRYVKPKELFVKRSRDGKHIVALMCSYKFNPESGIAVIFKDESFVSVGTQNEIL